MVKRKSSTMTPQQRDDLQRQLQEAKNRAEETKKQRHNEVAKKVNAGLTLTRMLLNMTISQIKRLKIMV